MNNMIYLAYDGDNAGRLVGRSILADDVTRLHEISERIGLGHELVKRWVEAHGGSFISGGGDEGIFALPPEALQNVEELRHDYQYATELTLTIGIGASLSEAGKAMMVGKMRGKNMVVQYDSSIENEIHASQERVGAGQGSDEEKKLNEAYLKQDNQDPNQANAAGSPEANPPGDNMAAQTGDPIESQIPGKKAEKDQEEAVGQDGKMVEGQNMSTPREQAQDSQTVEEQFQEPAKDIEQGNDVADPVNNADESINNPDAASPQQLNTEKEETEEGSEDMENKNEMAKKGAKEVPGKDQKGVAQIQAGAQAPQEGQADVMDNIDDTDLAVGTEMEGNTSRPGGFSEQNTPGDMGLDNPGASDTNASALPENQTEEGAIDPNADPEADPNADPNADPEAQAAMEGQEGAEGEGDVAGVLKDGLDDTADQAQVEQVKQMIGQALEGFKANKDSLEQIKAQAPELYQSSISMLKAMIEMAKMLGLSDGSESIDGACPHCGKHPEEPPQQDGEEGAEGAEAGEEGEAPQGKGGFPPKKGEEKKDDKGGKPGEKKADKGAPPKKDDKKGGFPPKKDGKPAAPKEGAAKEGKKSDSPIGTSIGKLPTKQTTSHVARQPLAPGSVNTKGQQKVIDPESGKTRWVDRKKGAVLSNKGIPVRDPSQADKE